MLMSSLVMLAFINQANCIANSRRFAQCIRSEALIAGGSVPSTVKVMGRSLMSSFFPYLRDVQHFHTDNSAVFLNLAFPQRRFGGYVRINNWRYGTLMRLPPVIGKPFFDHATSNCTHKNHC